MISINKCFIRPDCVRGGKINTQPLTDARDSSIDAVKHVLSRVDTRKVVNLSRKAGPMSPSPSPRPSSRHRK